MDRGPFKNISWETNRVALMDGPHRTGMTSWLRGRLSALACSPFLMACLFTVRIPQGSAVHGEVSRPPLVFSQYSVNLRELPVEPVVHAHFDFWNKGTEPLTIEKLDPSCACLAPKLMDNQTTYQPGDHGRFYLQIRTANETPGPKEYQVRVNYRSGEATGSRLLTFKAIVPQTKISIEPPQLVFYQLNGKPGSQRLHVTDYRGTPLQVVSAEVDRDDVEVFVLDREVDKTGQLRVPIEVEVAGEVPPGKTIAKLKIRTTDPEFQELLVPVFLFGPSSSIRMASGTRDTREETSAHNPSPGAANPPSNRGLGRQKPEPYQEEP